MNRVVHFEIHAKDMDTMQKFYGDVFGWKITDLGAQMGNYRMVSTGQDAPGAKWPGISGGMTERKGDLPVHGQAVNAYVCIIDVENIDTMLASIMAAGGTMALEKVDVPGVGWLAYCKDPEGNLFGVMQPH